MSCRSLSVLALLSVLVGAAPLRADTLKVPQQFGTIQGAVNAAVEGDIVSVSKGVYRENVTVGTSGIALRGKGGAVIDGTYVGNCITVNASDVEVSGFTLVSGGTGQLLVSDGPPTAGGLQVIGDNAKVSKLAVRACEGYGIKIKNGSVENCTVDAISGIGIFVETLGSHLDFVGTVSKCKVYRSTIGILVLEGPFVIEKNIIDHCGSMGIYVVIETILLEGFLDVLPSRVTSNTVTNTIQFGMQLAIGSGQTTVEKNTVRDNGYGLYLQGFGQEVLSNTIEDNNLHGIILFATGAYLEKNKVRNNGGPGILVGAGGIIPGSPGDDGGNDVVNCQVEDNAGDGILVISNENEIRDCTLKDNLGDGIQVVMDASDNQLTDLSISNNGHDGIDNSGPTTLIQGNTSKGNGGADLAGKGDGNGTTDPGSGDNVTGDGTGLASFQELDMEIGDS